jgi:hypothetical protein
MSDVTLCSCTYLISPEVCVDPGLKDIFALKIYSDPGRRIIVDNDNRFASFFLKKKAPNDNRFLRKNDAITAYRDYRLSLFREKLNFNNNREAIVTIRRLL